MVAPDTPSPERQYNTKLGLILFVVYLILYLGFVLINAYQAQVMETIVFAGLNLAIIYGFALIVIALVLALIYGAACRTEPLASSPEKTSDSAEHTSVQGGNQE